MKILLAADGSAYSMKAARYVLEHLNWFQGKPELHILHVKVPIPLGHARATVGHEVVEEYYRETSGLALKPIEDFFKGGNIAFKSGYRIGNVAEEIQDYVKKYDIDLIVMGSHGHGALLNLVLGSVANKVLAIASVPVLITR